MLIWQVAKGQYERLIEDKFNQMYTRYREISQHIILITISIIHYCPITTKTTIVLKNKVYYSANKL